MFALNMSAHDININYDKRIVEGCHTNKLPSNRK